MGSNGLDEYLRPFYVQRIDSVDVVVTNDDPQVQKPSTYSQINMMQKIRFKPNDEWDFQYGFHYSETSHYSRYDRHVRYKNGLPRYGEWSYGPQKWMMNNLNITHNSNNSLYDQMSVRLAQQFFEESRITRDINKADREIRNEKVDAYSANIDLSIARMFGDVLKIDASGYYSKLQNALVRRDFTLNGLDSIVYDGTLSQVQAIQNTAVANVYGIQAGFELKLAKGFSFSSDYNYQIGEEGLDDGSTSPSRYAAPWFGISRLTYNAHKLSLQFYAVYSGEKPFDELPESEKSKDYIYAIDDNGNPYSPGWYTLNLKARYQFAENFSVSAGLKNITDQRYRPYSSGIVAPGRNFILSMGYNF